MILEINLLPEELRKKRRAFQFKALADNAKKFLRPVIAGFILIHLFIPLITFTKNLRLKQAKRTFTNIQPQKEEIDEVRNQLQKFKSLDELFRRLRSQRLAVAPRLNIISDYLPQGVWLSELSVSKNVWEIKGSCIFGIESEMAQIGEFLQALKSDARFAKDFAGLELVSVQRKKLGPTEIVDFIFGSKPKIK